MKTEWILCPVCGRKTHNKIREDTEIKNFPLYCPKCKQEGLIDVKDLQVIDIGEKTHKTQSQSGQSMTADWLCFLPKLYSILTSRNSSAFG